MNVVFRSETQIYAGRPAAAGFASAAGRATFAFKNAKGPRAQGPRATDLERRKPTRSLRSSGQIVAAHGRPAVPGDVAPAAAAYHAVGAPAGCLPRLGRQPAHPHSCRASRLPSTPRRSRACRTTPRRWALFHPPDESGRPSFLVPSRLIEILFGVAGIKTGAGTGPAGILPLRLARQPQPGPGCIALGILPAHAHHRLAGLVELPVCPIFRRLDLRVVLEKAAVFLVGHGIAAHVELRHPHFVTGSFIFIAAFLRRRRAHHERSARDPHQFVAAPFCVNDILNGLPGFLPHPLPQLFKRMLGKPGLQRLHLFGIDAFQNLQGQKLPLPEFLLFSGVGFQQLRERLGADFGGIVQAHLHHGWGIGKRRLPDHFAHEGDKQGGILQGQQQQGHLLPPAFAVVTRQLAQNRWIRESAAADLARRQVLLEPQVHETVLIHAPAGQKPALVADGAQEFLGVAPVPAHGLQHRLDVRAPARPPWRACARARRAATGRPAAEPSGLPGRSLLWKGPSRPASVRAARRCTLRRGAPVSSGAPRGAGAPGRCWSEAGGCGSARTPGGCGNPARAAG